MHFTTLTTALALAGAFAEARPTKKGTTIHQVATGKYKLRSGPVATRKTYLKYAKSVPANIEQAARHAMTKAGDVTATPEAFDVEYLCPVSVGTPAQNVSLDFDTGSADTWVFSSLQDSSQVYGHALYTPSSSSTSNLMSGSSWGIHYADGSGAAGTVYSDKVTIGAVTATSQAVECATSASSMFVSDWASSGLVGLAFDSVNRVLPNKVPTFMDNVKSSLHLPIFTSYLKHASPGAYTFGWIDRTKYKGKITYAPISNQRGFWEFTAGGYAIGLNKTVTDIDVIADTGTTLMYLPSSIVSNYYAQISGSFYDTSYGAYLFPCSSSPPSFGVVVNGVVFWVPGSYMNYGRVESQNCYGGLQSSDGFGLGILGDVFLKSVYAIFDLSTPRIGFAVQK